MKVAILAIYDGLLRKKAIFPCLLIMLTLSACASAPESKANTQLFEVLKKADAAYSEANWLAAEQYYQQLIDKVPDDAYAWMRLGNTRLQQGRLKAAIIAYQESLRHDPEQPKPYYNLSTAYMLQAQQALEQARLKLQPQDPGLVLVTQRILGLQELTTSNAIEGTTQKSDLEDNSKPVIRYFMR